MDSKKYLLLKPLNLYPELSNNKDEMVEQILNAIIAVLPNDLHHIFTALTRIEAILKNIRNNANYNAALIEEKLVPILKHYDISIVNEKEVEEYIIFKFNNRLQYFENKKDSINHMFLSLKKVEYHNGGIEFLPIFYDWILDLVHKKHNLVLHNNLDDFMNSDLFPNLQDNIEDMMNIIERRTNSYINKLRHEYSINRTLA
jgi:uncharacterized protein YejL (UPF0352 family)